MNPKVQELLNSVKQLVTEIEAGESGEMETEGMDEGAPEDMGEGSEEGGAEVEVEMKPPMRKKMGGGMPESLRNLTGGR